MEPAPLRSAELPLDPTCPYCAGRATAATLHIVRPHEHVLLLTECCEQVVEALVTGLSQDELIVKFYPAMPRQIIYARRPA